MPLTGVPAARSTKLFLPKQVFFICLCSPLTVFELAHYKQKKLFRPGPPPKKKGTGSQRITIRIDRYDLTCSGKLSCHPFRTLYGETQNMCVTTRKVSQTKRKVLSISQEGFSGLVRLKERERETETW